MAHSEWLQALLRMNNQIAARLGSRTLIIVLSVLMAILASSAMRYVLGWSVSTIASAWVAFGTLALALTTWWSVSQTRMVVAGEDRRHQQSFIPIVEIKYIDVSDAPSGMVCAVAHNIGKGPALAISASLRGTLNLVSVVPGTGDQKAICYSVDHLKFELSAGAVEGTTERFLLLNAYDFKLTTLTNAKVSIQAYNITSAHIFYKDLFGNEYISEYEDFAARRYHLVQPASLSIPTK